MDTDLFLALGLFLLGLECFGLSFIPRWVTGVALVLASAGVILSKLM
jgi:membrane protein implicated in regulation of membrane protease activity